MPPTSGTWIRQFWPARALGIPIVYPTPSNQMRRYAGRTFTKAHENGWTITATLYGVREQFLIIHEFDAIHAVHGRVYGDLQVAVHATTELGYQSFMDEFPYTHDLLPAHSPLALAAPRLDSVVSVAALTTVLRANI